MIFKSIIEKLMEGHKLSTMEAYTLMTQIGEGAFNDSQNTALIISLSSRDISLEELTGFRAALLDLSLPVNLREFDTIDLCGTGGDGKNTFNISTLAAFVVAAAGYKVAKHGNYGVSSLSGSSNVLEQLGYAFSNEQSKLSRELEQFGICFLHAPLFHPALKNVALARRQLGIKTLFNTLGPLVNPAQTPKQLVGVYNLKLARLYHYLLQQDGKVYTVLHSLDGYDEISLTDKVQCFSTLGEQVLDARSFGLLGVKPIDIIGGDTLNDSRDLFLKVIANKGKSEQNQVVMANAAMAIQCFEPQKSLLDCVSIAEDALTSGKANQLLKQLIQHQ